LACELLILYDIPTESPKMLLPTFLAFTCFFGLSLHPSAFSAQSPPQDDLIKASLKSGGHNPAVWSQRDWDPSYDEELTIPMEDYADDDDDDDDDLEGDIEVSRRRGWGKRRMSSSSLLARELNGKPFGIRMGKTDRGKPGQRLRKMSEREIGDEHDYSSVLASSLRNAMNKRRGWGKRSSAASCQTWTNRAENFIEQFKQVIIIIIM